jgi:peptidyl-prolyl cis-trans isomerase D
MLQRIRDGLQGQKWLAWLVLGAVGATFVFWGGSNSLDFSGVSQTDAAKVDGEEIPATEATRAWSESQARWSQQFGTEIPEDQRVRIQENILDSLITRKLLRMRLEAANFRVSETTVLSEFQNIPAFKDADGKYDPALAREALRQNGTTERELFDDTRFQLIMNQLQQGLADSSFLTPAEARRLNNLENEEREVQYIELAADRFMGSEPIDEAAIRAYYDKNGDRFMTTESVSLEYAELRLEQLATQVVPTEAELRKIYDENRASYMLEERRRTRHILIPIAGDDDAGALKKAESVLAEARAGKDFAELAQKYSTDITAKDGGELGFIERKQFAGPFGDALFAMKVGEITGPVKSQFGYHIIKLEEIQAAEGKPFEDVRAELDSQYRSDRSQELFGTRQEEVAEAVEKRDSDLDQLAKKFELTRGSIPVFQRGGGAEALGSSRDLQQVVFSDEVLNQGRIGGPIPLGDDRIVLVKVSGHRKSEVKPLAEVHDEIVALLRQERGVAGAKAAVEAAVAKLSAGESLDALAKTWSITPEPARFVSRGDPSMPAALRTAVFEAPRPEGKSVVRSATLDNGSSAVFIITRTRVGDSSANPQLVRQQTMLLRERVSAGAVRAYVDEMKRKAKIVKNPKVFEQ